MNKTIRPGLGMAFLCASLLATPARSQTPAPAQSLSLAASFQRSYNQMKRFITGQAERMPEADYA